jgi:phosphoketolase
MIVDLLRRHAPDLRVRVINVLNLMKLQPPSEHPHGMSDHDFDALFSGEGFQRRHSAAVERAAPSGL